MIQGKRSGSLLFPFKEDNETSALKRATTVEEVLRSSIICFLLTEPGQRRGNPVGSFVGGLIQQTVPDSQLPGLSDQLKKELSDQFVGVQFIQAVIVRDSSVTNIRSYNIRIKFTTPFSDVSELSVQLQG